MPDVRQRFNPVPTRRHADVYERHRVRAALGARLAHQLKSLAALLGRREFEHPFALNRYGQGAKQCRFRIGELLRRFASAQQLPEVLVNSRVVVDNQHAAIRPVGFAHTAPSMRQLRRHGALRTALSGAPPWARKRRLGTAAALGGQPAAYMLQGTAIS